MNNIFIALIIMAVMGILGGITNGLRKDEEEKFNLKEFCRKILIGIIGSFSIPLILQMISSDVLKWVSDIQINAQSILIFIAFCSVGGFASERLLGAISGKLETMIKEAKNESKSAKKKIDQIEEVISEGKIESDSLRKMSISPPTAPNEDEKKIIKSLQNPNYLLRSEEGIANEIKYTLPAVSTSLNELQSRNIVKSYISKDGSTKWHLTQIGKDLVNTD